MVDNFSSEYFRYILTVQQHEEDENIDHFERFAPTNPIVAML